MTCLHLAVLARDAVFMLCCAGIGCCVYTWLCRHRTLCLHLAVPAWDAVFTLGSAGTGCCVYALLCRHWMLCLHMALPAQDAVFTLDCQHGMLCLHLAVLARDAVFMLCCAGIGCCVYTWLCRHRTLCLHLAVPAWMQATLSCWFRGGPSVAHISLYICHLEGRRVVREHSRQMMHLERCRCECISPCPARVEPSAHAEPEWSHHGPRLGHSVNGPGDGNTVIEKDSPFPAFFVEHRQVGELASDSG